MCPELFHIGPIPIRSFGLMMALSFIVGIYYVRWVTKRDKRPFEPFLALAYIMIISGIVGARLAYVFLHWGDFAHNLTDIFNPFHAGRFGIAGLNLYGGILLGIVCSVVYIRWKKMSVLDVFDYFAPTIGLGIGVSRIGCYLNGCCFGTPTNAPWGVEFPAGSIPYSVFGPVHIHPAQLYSSAYGFLLFILLHFLLKRRQFIGQITAVLFMSEAIFRYLIEYVRYYEQEMHFTLWGMHPTYNQIVSIGLFLTGIVLYYFGRRRQAVPHGT
jgi:phosphatidylglycerol:prolipoprotein diacylglycerol transferase